MPLDFTDTPPKISPRILNGNLMKNHKILNGNNSNVFIYLFSLPFVMFADKETGLFLHPHFHTTIVRVFADVHPHVKSRSSAANDKAILSWSNSAEVTL